MDKVKYYKYMCNVIITYTIILIYNIFFSVRLTRIRYTHT